MPRTRTPPGFVDSTFKGLYDEPGSRRDESFGICRVFLDRVSRWWPSVANRVQRLSWALGSAVSDSIDAPLLRRHDGDVWQHGHTNFSNVEGAEDHSVKFLFLWEPEAKLSGVVINLAARRRKRGLYEISADSGMMFVRNFAAGTERRSSCCRNARRRATSRRTRFTEKRLSNSWIERGCRGARRLPAALPTLSMTPCRSRRHTSRTNWSSAHGVVADIPEQQPPVEPFYEPTRSAHRVSSAPPGRRRDEHQSFELYLDYGTRIEARSPAVMRCWCNSPGLPALSPTRRNPGRGYSADKFLVGPEGGQVLWRKHSNTSRNCGRDPPRNDERTYGQIHVGLNAEFSRSSDKRLNGPSKRLPQWVTSFSSR